MSIGTRMREARKEKKMTQETLAEETGLSVMTIRRYESGERMPTVDIVMRIADALGADGYYLATGETYAPIADILNKAVALERAMVEDTIRRFMPQDELSHKAAMMSPGQFNDLMIEYDAWLVEHEITHSDINIFISDMFRIALQSFIRYNPVIDDRHTTKSGTKISVASNTAMQEKP